MTNRSAAPKGADIIAALAVSALAFALLACWLWFCSYACFRKLDGPAVLDYRQAAMVSSQYMLSRVGLSLPQRPFSTWPGAPSWQRIETAYRPYPTALRAVRVSGWAGVAGGLILGSLTFLLVIQPPPTEIYRSGAQITSDARTFSQGLLEERDGVNLHPAVRISYAREPRHIFVAGGTGNGKSQIMIWPLHSALHRGDSVMIYDFKGDQTRHYLTPHDCALLAPWDSRGWALAVAKDITTKEHARTLADCLIPPSAGDPMWGSAARIVAMALFCSCIAERPGEWTLADAAALLQISDEQVQGIVAKFAPEGMRLVKDAKGKTTQSILVTLTAHFASLQALATAWVNVSSERTISINEWLKTGLPRRVILQGNGQLASLASGLHSAVFRMLLAGVASPSLPESHERRRWFFGDEFVQLGKVEQLVPLLQVARSKGVRFVLAAQDVPSVRLTYGADGAEAIIGAADTILITRSNSIPTREWASRLVGSQILERLETTQSYGGGGRSESRRWVETTLPLLRPDEFATRLGQVRVGKKYVTRAVVLCSGKYVGLLDWPRTVVPVIATAHEPAAWLSRPPAYADTAPAPTEAFDLEPEQSTEAATSKTDADSSESAADGLSQLQDKEDCNNTPVPVDKGRRLVVKFRPKQ